MRSVPYVQRVRRADGRLDLYFRKGETRRKLFSADGTEALEREVQRILSELEALEAAKAPIAGTIGGSLSAYLTSSSYLALAPSTGREYARLAADITADCGDVRLSEVTPSFVADLNEAWALRGYRAADIRVQVLRNALKPAVVKGLIPADPFLKVEKNRRPRSLGESNPAWTDEEVAGVIDEAIIRKQPGLARAVALGRWAGFRRGTICALPLGARVQAHDALGKSERRLQWVTEKRKVLADKREDRRLTELLSRTPNRALTVAYNKYGARWKERQLDQALARLVDRLAAQGKVRGHQDGTGKWHSPLTLHGLRHARGVELAMAGASDAEIMAQIEHATERAARIYRRQAIRRGLSDSGQDKVDQATECAHRHRASGTSDEPEV